MYRVVIVDDEPFMLEGMHLMIDWASCGFELVGEAGTAQEALRLIDALRPHLVITDVKMPGMLGTDLAAIVRNYHPDTILLFFSGYRDFAFAQAAIRSHAFGYLVKPIDSDEVHETLRKVRMELDARGQRDEAARESLPLLRDHVLKRIVMGDDSAESLLRAGVLLGLKRDEPCYCVVLHCKALPQSAALLLSTCGAVPFQLSTSQIGLCFRQIERDFAQLERLLGGLEMNKRCVMSVGDVGRGVAGFRQSLREALDAQGVLFLPIGALRAYRPYDAQTADWLAYMRVSTMYDALRSEHADALALVLKRLEQAIAQRKPSLFTLRYMAALLDSFLPLALHADSEAKTPLRALWEDETLSREMWFAAFREKLLELHGQIDVPPADDHPPAVRQTLEIIRTRYAEPLSMNGVAGDLHMNPAYLGQLVRRHTGATFHQLLLDMRVSYACRLLRQTARAVGDIAMSVGFRDVDYFSQQFRRRMGMSPHAYRSPNQERQG